MRFAFVLALVALTAGAERPERYGGRDMRSGGRGGVGTTPTYLEFAPSSGAGLPVISHHNTALCDALAAEVPTWSAAVDGGAGNWCLGGDGLAVGGSQVTFSTFGSPSVIDTPVCPSGLDCLAATGQPVKALQTGTGQGSAATAAVASGTGAMTACWWGQLNATMAGSDFPILAHATSTAAGSMPWELDHYLGKFRIAMVDGAGNYSVSEATGDPNSVTFFCGSHAGGTGVARGYLNGTAATAGASMTRASETYKPTLHGYNGTSDGAVGQTSFGAFYVDQELSAAQIAAISRRVLADVPKAVIRGGQSYVDMSYTRTGSRFCAKADNTGSIVPANRPCISQSGYLSEGPATNLLVRSQELLTTPWASFGVLPIGTANYGTAPDGTKTAERLVVTSVPAGESVVAQPLGLASGSYAVSLYVKGTSGSGSIDLGTTAALYASTKCSFTADAWTRCEHKVPAGTIGYVYIGCEWGGGTVTSQCSTNPDVLLWGAQVETGSVATSYIPTTSAAASRGADLGYFVDPTPTINPARLSTALTASITSASGQYASFLRLAGSSYQTDTGGSGVWLYSDSSFGTTFRALSFNNAGGAGATSGSIAPPASPFRVVAYNDGSNLSFAMGTTTATPGAFTPGAFENIKYIDIGNQQGSATLDSIGGRISKVCLDPRPTRCR